MSREPADTLGSAGALVAALALSRSVVFESEGCAIVMFFPCSPLEGPPALEVAAVAEPRMDSEPEPLVAVDEIVFAVPGLSVRSSPDSSGDFAIGASLSFSRSIGPGERGRLSGERGLRELED